MSTLRTLRMGDGPLGNIPPGLDALAGYVNVSGIGATWPTIQAMPARYHLSITTNGSPADCADVESGAMGSWAGYTVGYCAVSRVNALVAAYGRPRKLWTAHRDPTIGAHICSPACWAGLVTTADGTQWTDHGGAWDESLLRDDFFDYQTTIPTIPIGVGGKLMYYILETTDTNNAYLVEFKLGGLHKTYIPDPVALGEFQKTLVVVKANSAEASAIPSVGPGPTG